MASTLVGRQAVVIGASMAGLAVAGALADHFEQIIVLERDTLPSDAAHRAGTPQSRHLHALLGGGQRALGELFPGFERELEDAGAVSIRIAEELRSEMPGFDPFPSRDLGLRLYSMSRPLIEWVVRRRVRQLSNVELRERCRGRELVIASDRATVTGVRCETNDGRSETINADLVIDATGRAQPTLALLHTSSYVPPQENVIGVDIGYSTAIFSLPEDPPGDWKAFIQVPKMPDTSRGAFMAPLEGGERWIVTLAGRYDEKPPGDGDGFLRFAEQLRTPTLFDAIGHRKCVGEPVRYGFMQSVWRHFERLEHFPRGLLPFGDGICRFNPVWGQGMTVAAQEAVLLRRLLGAGDGDPIAVLAPTFFAAAAELIETPWMMAATPDFAMPQTGGERPEDLERRLKFGGALTRLAAEDQAVHKLMFEVRQLLKPNSALRDPELVARIEALMAEA
jgi:2-polyprenyl-6-methoxyphenol hydroxylase-like FAD-dependent oxidoreductase